MAMFFTSVRSTGSRKCFIIPVQHTIMTTLEKQDPSSATVQEANISHFQIVLEVKKSSNKYYCKKNDN